MYIKQTSLVGKILGFFLVCKGNVDVVTHHIGDFIDLLLDICSCRARHLKKGVKDKKAEESNYETQENSTISEKKKKRKLNLSENKKTVTNVGCFSQIQRIMVGATVTHSTSSKSENYKNQRKFNKYLKKGKLREQRAD